VTDDPESGYDHPPNRRGDTVTRKHEVVISHGDTDRIIPVPCQGKGCPLCASTAESRARITFVKKEQ
jgi:hypothetical protein